MISAIFQLSEILAHPRVTYCNPWHRTDVNNIDGSALATMVCYHGAKRRLKTMKLEMSSPQQNHAQPNTRKQTSCLMYISRWAWRLKQDQSDDVESDAGSQASVKFPETGRTFEEITTIKLSCSTTWHTKLNRRQHQTWSLWPMKKMLSVSTLSDYMRWLLVDMKKPTQGSMFMPDMQWKTAKSS